MNVWEGYAIYRAFENVEVMKAVCQIAMQYQGEEYFESSEQERSAFQAQTLALCDSDLTFRTDLTASSSFPSHSIVY